MAKISSLMTILLIFLGLRFISQIVLAVIQLSNPFFFYSYIAFGILYGLALVFLLIRKRVGLYLTGFLAGIDLIFALLLGGATGIGAGIFDVILLFFSFKEFQSIKKK